MPLPPAPKPKPKTLQGKRILVVEDNAINQQLTHKMLQFAGLQVKCVENGQQALNLLELAEFDAVLMDLQMPVMDGFEATRLIRNSTKPFAEIPILAVTANAFAEERQICLQTGMNDYLAKPFSQVQLVAMLEQALTPPA